MVATYCIIIRIDIKDGGRKVRKFLPTSEGIAYRESIAIIDALIPKMITDKRISRIRVYIMNMSTQLESAVFDSDDRR